MIGTDNIAISLALAPNLQVGVKDGLAVVDSGTVSTIKLSDVRTGFICGGRRRVVDDENDSDIVVKELLEVKDGSGEEWEMI